MIDGQTGMVKLKHYYMFLTFPKVNLGFTHICIRGCLLTELHSCDETKLHRASADMYLCLQRGCDCVNSFIGKLGSSYFVVFLFPPSVYPHTGYKTYMHKFYSETSCTTQALLSEYRTYTRQNYSFDVC